ncbi:hypothetical protein M2T28_14220 [Elizabethkingia miricola]|jgi:predicted RNase H-like nuclease (RuvC/YqgF family)|uniref:hypothetical protein n=1 Tax=Elizabethkingia TaxID=308865 RepID=UPI0010C1D18D|nr:MULTISPECIES: hypothetical protein [Elizabethkingia]MCL1653776.1 hypothetical protein [Elizabethkingia miricola]QCO45760.1 hypothetical protein FCS00_05020 [Elizabethkingia sp. 2-6]WQM37687.1 hypothetical protein U2S95_15110 [Elizabethkingia miricola]DAN07600.1 MAG TPA: hypothetical protein [Crassvirales sp.]
MPVVNIIKSSLEWIRVFWMKPYGKFVFVSFLIISGAYYGEWQRMRGEYQANTKDKEMFSNKNWQINQLNKEKNELTKKLEKAQNKDCTEEIEKYRKLFENISKSLASTNDEKRKALLIQKQFNKDLEQYTANLQRQ